MTPDEIKQRMDELDAELAEKLRTMGFSDAEVARVLDNRIPAEQRDAEIKDILAREFIKQANDPRSGIMDEVIRRVEAELAVPPPRKRRWPIVVAALGAAVVGVVLYMALRTKPVNACIAELGRLDRFGALKMGKPLGGASCWVSLADATGETKLSVRNSTRADVLMMKRVIEERAYAGHETFTAGRYTVDFYVAAGATWSQDKLQDEIMHRVGRSRDPTGDALQAMPPAEHVALVAHGDAVTELQLDGRTFPTDKAKQLVTAIVSEWP